MKIWLRGSREGNPDFVPFPEPIAPRGTPRRREQDIRMLKSPQHWPNRVLPLKSDGLSTAIWDGEYLYVGSNLWSTTMPMPPEKKTPEQIVDAGWTVD